MNEDFCLTVITTLLIATVQHLMHLDLYEWGIPLFLKRV